MTGIILAGGYGTRLRPLTNNTPKCLIQIDGKPMIYYVIKYLKLDDLCDKIVISAGYLGDQVVNYVLNCGSDYNCEIVAVVEPVALGTGGGVEYAMDTAGVTEAIVINGDTLIKADLTQFVEKCTSESMGVIGAMYNNDVADYGHVIPNEAGKLVEFNEKSGIHAAGLINSGINYIKRELLNYSPDVPNYSLTKDVFPIATKMQVPVEVVQIHPEYFSDAGTETSLKATVEYVRQSKSC